MGTIDGVMTPISSASAVSPVCIARSLSPLRNAPSTTRTNVTTPRYWSYTESNISARGGASGLPRGGGTEATTASSTSSMPWPVFAEIRSTFSGRSPMRSAIARACRSGSAAGRSILLSTGMISRSASMAR